MKFSNIKVGEYVQRKEDGVIFQIISFNNVVANLSGSDCGSYIAINNTDDFRKVTVKDDFKEQFDLSCKAIGKIVFLNARGIGEYRIIDEIEDDILPVFIEDYDNHSGWEYAMSVANPKNFLAVAYNKRVDAGFTNKEEAIELIKLLNKAEVKEVIHEI